MGTHPIFESDFDCLTDNRIHTAMGHLEAELTNDMVKLFRRPSIAPEEVRRSSKANIEAQMSTLAPSKSDEKVGSSGGAGRQAKLDDSEDLEKIMSLQYTINFDVVFNVDYTTRTTTLSSIDLMKQEIEEQYKQKSEETGRGRVEQAAPVLRSIFYLDER